MVCLIKANVAISLFSLRLSQRPLYFAVSPSEQLFSVVDSCCGCSAKIAQKIKK